VTIENNRKQALLAWLFVGALATLSLVFGILQYRWIGEVSRAEGDRLRGSLDNSLNRLGLEFNTTITTASMAIANVPTGLDPGARHEQYAANFARWRETTQHPQLLRAVAIASPVQGKLTLQILDVETGAFLPAEWPAGWESVRDRLAMRLLGPRGPGGPFGIDHPSVIDLPYFQRSPSPGRGAEIDWLLVDVDTAYIGGHVLPDLIRRHLPAGYLAQVSLLENPGDVLFRLPPEGAKFDPAKADASVRMFDFRFDLMFRRTPPGPRGMVARRPERQENRGRWLLSVQHPSGSLEAVVARARNRNLAAVGAVMTLLLAASVALVRFTRRAQALASAQMQFLAGVSHELRTPLAVMRTAGHNLRNRVSSDPARVQQYGALIERESEKLTAIVDQILSFANNEAGRVIGAKQSISVQELVRQAIAAAQPMIEESHCVVDTEVDPSLPPIEGDVATLTNALHNLLGNAAKYGRSGGWIGVRATPGNGVVEIRVADRGEGIPADEKKQIFEPFFRGGQALRDQIHGTGLGLPLAKKIVEAHGGSLAVESEPGSGTEFIVRLPLVTV
jgi:signal transduction histidine kinase